MDWDQQTKKYQSSLLDDLTKLLKIKSVRNENEISKEYPVSKGPTKALDYFLQLAKRDGFQVYKVDNTVGYIEYGNLQSTETLAILAHVDVMPAGKEWDADPFIPQIKNDRLYARGALDDKGPGMAAYYGLKIVKDLKLPLKRKIHFVIGTDEESNWLGMNNYLKKVGEPTLGFSPDAEFPLINGEKGICTFTVSFPQQEKTTSGSKIIKFISGERVNMVPAHAEAIIQSSFLSDIEKQFNSFVQSNPIDGFVKQINDQKILLHVIGKAAHGAFPETGINAGTYLAKFLSTIVDVDLINFISQKLFNDNEAQKLSLAVQDDVMGKLSMNIGIINYNDNQAKVHLNFRYPRNISINEISKQLQLECDQFNGQINLDINKDPHYVDPHDELVQTLLYVYRKQCNDPQAQGLVVGGGTYGRLLKRGVAYGALFPNAENVMHQPNEYIDLPYLYKAVSIYAEVIARLG